MKTIKFWSSLPAKLKAIILDITENQEPAFVEEYDEMSSEEIDNLYIDIGGEG